MNAPIQSTPKKSYADIVARSKRVRWDLEADVLRGRTLNVEDKLLPDGLTLVAALEGFSGAERRLFSQVQGRTYAAMFGLVERFIAAKMLEVGLGHALGDQQALEAMVRFSDEELKHQRLFERLESMAAEIMPPGYRQVHDADAVARVVLGKSSWAVLALTCHIELFTLAHYRKSIEVDPRLSPVFKDALFFHFKEESQHTQLDEIEWRRADAKLEESERDAALSDFLDLVAAVDGLLIDQAGADAAYFCASLERAAGPEERVALEAAFLSAYRFQFITSGVKETRFAEILFGMLTPEQQARTQSALAPFLG